VAVPKKTIAVPKQKKMVPKTPKFKVPKKGPKRVATFATRETDFLIEFLKKCKTDFQSVFYIEILWLFALN
jgi:hypothetical protein